MSFKIPFTAASDVKEMFLHVQTTGIIHTKKDYYIIREKLEGMLLLSVLKGQGRLVYAGKQYKLIPGSTFLIDSRDHHELFSCDTDPMVFCFLHFSGPQSREYTRAIQQSGGTVLQLNKRDRILANMRHIILVLKGKAPDAPIRCASLIHEILMTFMLRVQSNIQQYSDSPEPMQRVLIYIEENYFTPLTLDSLASVANISKYHFTRLFKKHFGQSAYDYVLSVRINKAKEMLLNTNRSVSIIAEDCGFESLSHFSRSFKSRERFSPREYRLQNKESMLK
ncbi:MAG: AraC family transcriptional regulator [Spirochaetales bacterium]|nr:AraC family transcriptional regulator [Spirochaetales bacterium]